MSVVSAKVAGHFDVLLASILAQQLLLAKLCVQIQVPNKLIKDFFPWSSDVHRHGKPSIPNMTEKHKRGQQFDQGEGRQCCEKLKLSYITIEIVHA